MHPALKAQLDQFAVVTKRRSVDAVLGTVRHRAASANLHVVAENPSKTSIPYWANPDR